MTNAQVALLAAASSLGERFPESHIINRAAKFKTALDLQDSADRRAERNVTRSDIDWQPTQPFGA